ncbi:MAG: hypothetical protein KJ621_09040 [Proteobacteria bacterium]|nr:hypothetical protein [Pseudomonadota bacterium]MBU1741854.1 hypothetical protein [Pseudomonadota bacterium]
MDRLLSWIDPVLSAPYLWLGHQTFFGFLVATAPLALAGTIVGEASMWVAGKVLGREIKARGDKVRRYHDISLQALEHRDRDTFRAADKVAKEAFGQSFVLGLCLGIGSIWPCFFALAWLQHRFGYAHTVKLPLVGWNMGYIGVFIICYILVRIGYALVKARVRRRRADSPSAGGD